MSIKKKMGMGILAGALGVSLIGGGTWAAFNDVETTSNTFKAGTLDLVTSPSEVFNLSNLKPGDWFEKELTLSNNGSLTIKDILVSTSVDNFVEKRYDFLPENGQNTQTEFLQQFNVIITSDKGLGYTGTLADLQGVTNSDMFGDATALESGDSITFNIKIEFKNVDETYDGSRYQKQNKFQGESADFTIKFEAKQADGVDRSND